MAAPTRGTKSLKDYLKKYESNNVEEKKKKKKKRKTETKGVLVVDEDPVWKKSINLEEEENEDDSVDERPLVDEDIEVKRMKRLEQIRARRPFNSIAEDGSGWISFTSEQANTSEKDSEVRNNSRSLGDLSPSRHKIRNHSLSPPVVGKLAESTEGTSFQTNDKPPKKQNNDLVPPRRKRYDSPSPEPENKPRRMHNDDLSPPRRERRYSSSPERKDKPRSKHSDDLSPPRRKRYDSPSPDPEDKPPLKHNSDLSPPRRKRIQSPSPKLLASVGLSVDMSLPRRKRGRHASPSSNLSPPRKPTNGETVPKSLVSDLSPPRRSRRESPPLNLVKEHRKTGLISGREIQGEILKSKKDEMAKFEEMDPMLSGRGAEPVFRDMIKGKRISKEEYLKSKKKGEEKPKEIKLEWGKGLAQKREAEAKLEELETEKSKPFARTRDDPDLDNMLKERLRWGDPMAHLVKKKQYGSALQDFGSNEKMLESGFMIPQDIPNHSWIKRGLEAASNRYEIKPGRHWDGVDRSNGYEKKMFQRTNEKRATEREAYLWSVSDM